MTKHCACHFDLEFKMCVWWERSVRIFLISIIQMFITNQLFIVKLWNDQLFKLGPWFEVKLQKWRSVIHVLIDQLSITKTVDAWTLIQDSCVYRPIIVWLQKWRAVVHIFIDQLFAVELRKQIFNFIPQLKAHVRFINQLFVELWKRRWFRCLQFI